MSVFHHWSFGSCLNPCRERPFLLPQKVASCSCFWSVPTLNATNPQPHPLAVFLGLVFFLFCFSPALTNSTYSRTSFKWARAVPELRACPLPSAWCPARGPRRESRGGSAPLPSLAAGCGADVPSTPQWDGFAPTRIFEDKVPSCVFPACLPFPPENPVCYHFAAVRKSFPQHVLERRADGEKFSLFPLIQTCCRLCCYRVFSLDVGFFFSSHSQTDVEAGALAPLALLFSGHSVLFLWPVSRPSLAVAFIRAA